MGLQTVTTKRYTRKLYSSKDSSIRTQNSSTFPHKMSLSGTTEITTINKADRWTTSIQFKFKFNSIKSTLIIPQGAIMLWLWQVKRTIQQNNNNKNQEQQQQKTTSATTTENIDNKRKRKKKKEAPKKTVRVSVRVFFWIVASSFLVLSY